MQLASDHTDSFRTCLCLQEITTKTHKRSVFDDACCIVVQHIASVQHLLEETHSHRHQLRLRVCASAQLKLGLDVESLREDW